MLHEEIVFFCIPLFSKDCIGCIVAKTNIHDCVVGTNVPTYV